MVRSHVLHALRLPLLLLAILALLWLGLATAEGTSAHPRSLKASNTSSSQGTDFGNPAGNADKHCKDGHGNDDQHNKHCRPISDD